MDSIIKNTIRVTKCLLSYGVDHNVIEKILFYAYMGEIERYPLLYEKRVDRRGCKNCGVYNAGYTCIGGCTSYLCKICNKIDGLCIECKKLIENKCPLCNEIPSIPVGCYLLQCSCQNIYCLTCIRDATGLNEPYISTFDKCHKCGIEATISNFKTANNTYYFKETFARLLDIRYGIVECPRKCGFKCLRIPMRYHLAVCPNAKK